MDHQSVFSARTYAGAASSYVPEEDSNQHIRAQLEAFILDFRLDNSFLYRLALLAPALSPHWSFLLMRFHPEINYEKTPS